LAGRDTVCEALAANTCLYCPSQSPEMGEWHSLILTHLKRTILSVRLMLSMEAFNYLAFLLISYTAFGLILQSHVALQTSMQGLRKSHFLLWPQDWAWCTSKCAQLPGLWRWHTLLRLFIVLASKEPGHIGDKRILLKAPCKRKYLFSHNVPTNVILSSTAGSLRRWKWRGLNRSGRDLVRWMGGWEPWPTLNWRMLGCAPSCKYSAHSYKIFHTPEWH
jgi:hypothetical protein